MSTPLRLSLHALAALLLGFVGLSVLPAPAGATVTRLCTGYTSCANAGMSHAGYASAGGTMYWRMYSGHNCTNYAAYRMVRSGMPNERPWDGGGNATYWGTSNPEITDTVPRVGSIAWWRAGVYPAGSSGHVAYVEKVVSNDEIIVSQDSWGGDFSWARITRGSGWPSGFVHFNDVPLRNTVDPEVTGTPRVGESLRASQGRWKPGNPDVVLEWRAGRDVVQVGSLRTLEVTRAMVDKRIKVVVIASKLGFPTRRASSERTAAVRPGDLSSTSAPTISGETRVGSTLTLTPGRWSPKAQTKTFQWRADGAPIGGATTRSLELTPDLAGSAITVAETAERSGYAPATVVSAATARVQAAVITADRPRLSGEARLGSTLLLDPGTASPRASRTIVWLRDGRRVEGLDGRRYEVTRDDLGSRLGARVTWRRDGFRRVTTLTPESRVVRTVPVVRVDVERLAGRFVATATVSAAGLDRVPGRLVLREGARVLADRSVRDGEARFVVRDVAPGDHVYRFVLAKSPTTTRVVKERFVRMR